MAKLTAEQLHEVNMQRESWCRVETARNFWNLPQRKHFRCHLRSGGEFSALQTPRPEERSAWMQSGGAETAHPERRHFEDQYRVHLV